jgi:tetratricopeptide (TPR) repeat protein
MKILKYLIILIYSFFLFTNSNAFLDKDNKGAQSTGREDLSFLEAKNSNFKKGKDSLKQAIKYNKKNKLKKSNKQLSKAIKYFVSAYEEEPNNIEVLNYLGLVYYMVGDIIMSEIYYQEALLINPNNNLINQKLGELYFNTERVNLAQEKLKKLSKCNCEEYSILKKIISGK